METRKSKIIDIHENIWVPGAIHVLVGYAVLLPVIFSLVFLSLTMMGDMLETSSSVFLPFSLVLIFIASWILYLILHYLCRKSKYVPIDWRFYTYFREQNVESESVVALNLRKFLGEKYRVFWLPRILRPRSYSRSFVLLVLNILLWGSAYWFVYVNSSHFSQYDSVYKAAVKITAKLPGGEVLLGIVFFVPLVFLYFLWVFIRPDAKSAFTAEGDLITLYLRPFGFDKISVERSEMGLFAGRSSTDRELQEVLSNTFSKVSFFVAIGSPKEKYPSLGALKSYFGDDEWRENILMWMKRSNIIVATIGTGETVWELQQLLEKGYVNKTILLFPHPFSKNGDVNSVAIKVWRYNIELFSNTVWSEGFQEIASRQSYAPIAVRLLDDGRVEAVTSRNVTESHYRAALMHFSADLLN